MGQEWKIRNIHIEEITARALQIQERVEEIRITGREDWGKDERNPMAHQQLNRTHANMRGEITHNSTLVRPAELPNSAQPHTPPERQ